MLNPESFCTRFNKRCPVPKTAPVLALLILFLNLPADPVYRLEPFEVTGTRLGRDGVSSSGSLNYVPGTGDLATTRPSDTWAALSTLPGLHVEQPSGLAGNAVLYLRGGEPNFTKVLFDGIELNNLNSSRGGTYDFNGISLSGVQRIDVLGGAHSAVYGSDSLSGVIAIQSMDWSGGSSLDAGVEAGEYGYFRSGLTLRQATQATRTLVSLNRLEETDLPSGEAFRGWRYNGGVLLRADEGTDFWLSFFGSDLDREHYPDDSGGVLFSEQDLLDHNTAEESGAQLSGRHRLSGSTELVARLAWYRHRAVDDSPGVLPGPRDPFGVPPNRFDSELERWKGLAYLRNSPMDQVDVVVGLEHSSESGTSESLVTYPWAVVPGIYELDTDTTSLFTELAVEPVPGQRAEAALRWDDMDGIGTVRTGRLAYETSLPGQAARLRLAYGEGFKKPSFFALGNPVVGNPGLRPEQSDLIEAGLVMDIMERRLQFRSTLFRQEFTDLIDLSESGPPQLVNLSSVISRGASLSLDYRGSGWLEQCTLHATWMDVEVVDSDELLRNRPEWKLGMTLVARLTGNLFLDMTSNYVGSRRDSSIPTGTVELDAYLRSDLALRWNFHEQLWMHLSVENLWDEAYQPVVGLPVPGRRLRVGLRWLR